MSNIYPRCQCTCWCYKQAERWLAAYGNLGNAGDWLRNARAKGLETGTEPRNGAILVLAPGVQGARALGHVAFVTDARDRHSVKVTQLDVPLGNCNPTNGQYSAGPGVGFIYPPGGAELTPEQEALLQDTNNKLATLLEQQAERWTAENQMHEQLLAAINSLKPAAT